MGRLAAEGRVWAGSRPLTDHAFDVASRALNHGLRKCSRLASDALAAGSSNVRLLARRLSPRIEYLCNSATTIRVRMTEAAPLARSCVTVAASNLMQQRMRLLAALSGMTVALFLLLLQIAVLDAVAVEAQDIQFPDRDR